MIYKNKQAAEAAADSFSLEKIHDGYTVNQFIEDDKIGVKHRGVMDSKESITLFHFHILKKGDLHWCRDGNDEHFRLYVFVENDNDNNPLFSELKDLSYTEYFRQYEPIGINIFDQENK
jgi:hypothetical protein